MATKDPIVLYKYEPFSYEYRIPSLPSIYPLGLTSVLATGGTITQSGGYTFHTFTSSGTFTPITTFQAQVLVVGGGGGGGGAASTSGGGGGGGALLQSVTVSAGSTAVVVGNGGAGAAGDGGEAGKGGDSSFFGVIGRGGGAGGAWSSSATQLNGGCGGGAGAYLYSLNAGGTGSQGGNGGSSAATSGQYLGAGGGGIGGAGGNTSSGTPGNGGPGATFVLGGISYTVGGGGGGGVYGVTSGGGVGGIGGGGNGQGYPGGTATAGTANTGGGGGGDGANPPGAAGGSGIVVIAYPSVYYPTTVAYVPDLITAVFPNSIGIVRSSKYVTLFDEGGTDIAVVLPAITGDQWTTGWKIGLSGLTYKTSGTSTAFCSNFGYDVNGYFFLTPGEYQHYYNPGDILQFNITRVDTSSSLGDLSGNSLMYIDIYVNSETIEAATIYAYDASATFLIEGSSYSSKSITWANISCYPDGITAGNTLSASSSSSEVLAFCSNVSSNAITFSSTVGFQSEYPIPLNLTMTGYDVNNNVLTRFSNPVTVLPGRLTFPGGSSNLTFYKNEYSTGIAVHSGLVLTGVPVSVPSLPVGLYFDGSGNDFTISGLPVLQTPNRTYQFIGSNSLTGQVVTKTGITIKVAPERITMTPSNAFVSLSTGYNITPVTITAGTPVGSHFFKFGLPTLPDGLVFQDLCGNTLTGTTSSNPITLAGVPTVTAARAGQAGSLSVISQTYGAGNNVISGSMQITYSFGETILFSNISYLSLFKDVAVSIPISAASYYPSGSPITVMQTNSLPAGLSLTYTDYSGVATLTGTPTSYDVSASYTISAFNQNGIFQSMSFPIYVAENTVLFSQPAYDTSYVFVVGRPLTKAITGYFPSNIQFLATAKSGCNVMYQTEFPLSTYGITLSSDGLLGGTPTNPLSTSAVSVMGTDSSFFSIGSTEILAEVIPDIFTFNTKTFAFNQNTTIDPFTVFAYTFSEQQIQSYSYDALPTGLIMDGAGHLTGRPSGKGSGTITMYATTAYSTGSAVYSYTISSDQLLLTTPSNSYSLSSGIPAIQLTGSTYSGLAVSSYQIVGITYGFTVTSNGLLGGTLSNRTYTHIPLVVSVTAGGVDVSAQLMLEGTYPNVRLYTIGGYGAPTFTSPTKTDYHWYLYVPIVPIKFTASGYYFVRSLPLGLSFNAVTGILSGTPTRLAASQSITIYAKNDSAVDVFVITYSVFQPFVARNQFSAGAYTAVVRETTLINAAKNAIDNEVIPSTETTLGGLMAPRGPDSRTAREPCCN